MLSDDERKPYETWAGHPRGVALMVEHTEALIAAHVAAALTEAADVIEGKACDGGPESCADVLAGAPCPYDDAAAIVRNLAAKHAP